MDQFVLTDALRATPAGVDGNGNVQTKVNGGNVAITDMATADYAAVDPDHSLHVKVTNTVSIRKAPLELTGSSGPVTVTTSEDEAVAQCTDRQALTLANTGANRIHVNFGGTATTDDLYLDPGQRITFDNVGEEAIRAVAVGGSSKLSVTEFKVAP